MAGARITGVPSLRRSLDDMADRWTSEASGTVSAGVEYAVYVEYGISNENYHAQPFIRPAAERVGRKLPAIAAEATSVDDLVRRVTLAVEAEAKALAPVDTGALRASIRAEFDGASGSATV